MVSPELHAFVRGIDTDNAPLVLGILEAHPEFVRHRLEAGPDHEMPIHRAVRRKDPGIITGIVSAMVEQGVPMDVRDVNDHTPLMVAAGEGLHDNVGFLMARGADPSATSKNGDALCALIRGRNQDDVSDHKPFDDTLELLLKHGAKVTQKALDVAELFDDTKTLERLKTAQVQQNAPKPALSAPAARASAPKL